MNEAKPNDNINQIQINYPTHKMSFLSHAAVMGNTVKEKKFSSYKQDVEKQIIYHEFRDRTKQELLIMTNIFVMGLRC